MSQLLIRDPAPAPPPANPTGPDQGVIEEARRRRRRRRTRTAVRGLLAAALIGAIVWALGGGASHAGSARSGGAGGARAVNASDPHAPAFNVRLVPSLTVGYVGWCVVIEEGRRTGASACGDPPFSSSPFLEEFGWGSAASHRETTVDVTTPRVAAIRLDGRVVPTVSLPGLPYGLRAARIVVPFEALQQRQDGMSVALNAAGRPIAPGPAGYERRAPVSSWRYPERPAHGVCGLSASGVPEFSVRGGQVLTALRALPSELVGHAFLPCAETEFRFQNAPIKAEVLLDATHPGRPPAPLPDWSPVAGTPGFFAEGGVTATRYANTWLIARQGSSLAERIHLLRHLTATLPLTDQVNKQPHSARAARARSRSGDG
jgi:hypothetical protein